MTNDFRNAQILDFGNGFYGVDYPAFTYLHSNDENPNFIAEMMQSATMKFRYPQLWSRLTLPKLVRELDGVMDIILAGLSVPIKTRELLNSE